MFQPNNNYGKGRPPGSKNKFQVNVKEAFEKLFQANIESLQDDLNKLEPRDRLKIILELSQFLSPKMRASASDVSISQNYDDVPLFNINLGDVEMK